MAEYDVVVNCILQHTDNRITFVRSEELDNFRLGALFVDVSCDEGMGFEWARATSFAEPTVAVAPGITYYAVDHSPSYLWNSATWEIRDGVIQNPRVVSFQAHGGVPAQPTRRRAVTAATRPPPTASRSTPPDAALSGKTASGGVLDVAAALGAVH